MQNLMDKINNAKWWHDYCLSFEDGRKLVWAKRGRVFKHQYVFDYNAYGMSVYTCKHCGLSTMLNVDSTVFTEALCDKSDVPFSKAEKRYALLMSMPELFMALCMLTVIPLLYFTFTKRANSVDCRG